MPLLAVPNLAEGRDPGRIVALEAAFAEGVTLLDRHSDRDHNRTVLTLGGGAEALAEALGRGAGTALARIDMAAWSGLHPCVGAFDVCPLVWLAAGDREAARAAALGVAGRIGALDVPVFLYGELATSPERTERAYFREGGLERLAERLRAGELAPDAGPPRPHPRGGATLVTARPPLAAFNVELEPGDVAAAKEIAAALRESGGGLPGVRAIGLLLSSGRTQVSTNVHDPVAVPLGAVVERVRELAAARAMRPVAAELVGLVPEGALDGYPEDVPIRGFDADSDVIERRLS